VKLPKVPTLSIVLLTDLASHAAARAIIWAEMREPSGKDSHQRESEGLILN
jgi:hypothetical protein